VTRFIGIDYSTTSCGVAIYDDEHSRWQVFTLKSKSTPEASLPDYYERIRALADDIVSAADPLIGDVLAIEGLAFAGRGSSVDRLHYAWHRTVERLSRHVSGGVLIVTTNQVKQLATGKGNADKDAVLLATERRIPQAQVRGNDEADAVWIAVGASVLHGEPVIDLPAAHMPKAWKSVA
jgi:Holliday junction resolvasome RuvABC endonuclease subunit